MADLVVKRYECPDDGYLMLKTKTSGDEGFCPLQHDAPVKLQYMSDVVLQTQ